MAAGSRITLLPFLLVIYFAEISWCDIILTSESTSIRELKRHILDNILLNYDSRIKPPGENGNADGPTIVNVNAFVRSISKIDDTEMEYNVQLNLRQEWTDERLKFDDHGGKIKRLQLTESTRIWMPDTFFSNEKEGHFHNIIKPNFYIRINPHGSVLYNTRISLTLACPMNLKLFPFDHQVCSIRMASYGHTTDDIVFLWKTGDPVQVVRNLVTQHFKFEMFTTDYCNSKTNSGEEYSCLKVDLLFKRQLGYYLVHMYIPCAMLVIVSWVSFWFDKSAVSTRVSIGIVTLLTLVIKSDSIYANVPTVNYTMAIDVWTGICFTFVFASLLEFATVHYMSRYDVDRDNKKNKRLQWEKDHSAAAAETGHLEGGTTTFDMNPFGQNGGDISAVEEARQCETQTQPSKEKLFLKVLSKLPTIPYKLDVISRIVFPSIFALFNLVYWSIYLSGSSRHCTTDDQCTLYD